MENTKELTVQDIKDRYYQNVQQATGYVEKEIITLPYPYKPAKPILLKNQHNSVEVLQYSKVLEKYEKELEQHKENVAEYSKQRIKADNLIRDYIKDISGLNDIEEKYRDKVWNKAWEDGSSESYSAVYNSLISLLEIFE